MAYLNKKISNTQSKVTKLKVNNAKQRTKNEQKIPRNQVEHRGHPHMGLSQLWSSLPNWSMILQPTAHLEGCSIPGPPLT